MTTKTNFQSYESALAELETIVQAMEAGELTLEQSLAQYKRGSELLQTCQKMLTQVEQDIKILNENNNLTVFESQ
jgi:exodeoxyribonuclease VII small subunit